MNKLFTSALFAAYTQAENILEDQAVARELATKLEFDSVIEEGRMLAQEMRDLAGQEDSSSDQDLRQLYHRHYSPLDRTKTYRNGKNRKEGLSNRYPYYEL